MAAITAQKLVPQTGWVTFGSIHVKAADVTSALEEAQEQRNRVNIHALMKGMQKADGTPAFEFKRDDEGNLEVRRL